MRTIARIAILIAFSAAAVLGTAVAASANMPDAIEYTVMLGYSPAGNTVAWPMHPSVD